MCLHTKLKIREKEITATIGTFIFANKERRATFIQHQNGKWEIQTRPIVSHMDHPNSVIIKIAHATVCHGVA